MKPHIQFLQLRFERRWELNNYKTNLRISEDERLTIVDFAKQNYLNDLYFTKNSYGAARHYCILNRTKTPVSSLAYNIRNRVYEQFGISSFKEEPIFGVFLGVNAESGFVHQHTDATENGLYHVRLNFMLSKPYEGGMPVINEQEFNVDEGESWVNLASEWFHRSTPVVGDKIRVVLSLGALVEKTQLDPILKGMGID